MLVPGLVSVTFRQLPVPEVVRLAADAGLRAIEWGGDVHVPTGDEQAAVQAKVSCRDAGIAVCSYGSYFRAGVGDPNQFADVLRTAVALEAPSIRVWAGERGSGDASLAERTRTVHALRAAAASAAEHGITVALEYHRNTLTDSLTSTQQLLREVSHDNLTAYWQPRADQDPGSALSEVSALLPSLRAVHVFSRAAGGPNGTDRLPLAAREDLWQPVLAAMSAARNDRYALLEFVPDDSPESFRRDAGTLLSWL